MRTKNFHLAEPMQLPEIVNSKSDEKPVRFQTLITAILMIICSLIGAKMMITFYDFLVSNQRIEQ